MPYNAKAYAFLGIALIIPPKTFLFACTKAVSYLWTTNVAPTSRPAKNELQILVRQVVWASSVLFLPIPLAIPKKQ